MAVRSSAVARPRIGLALGGGGARGWAHIGVIDALAEAGIEPDVVCGTSMGALVGAAYVAGRMPELRRFAGSLDRRGMVKLVDIRLTRGGLLDGRRIVSLLRKNGVDAAIPAHGRAFAAIATDLETGAEILLRSGSILEAVRASISVPGVLSPVRVDGRWLGDGGMVNPVPVSACRALGADIVVAVNLTEIVDRPLKPNAAARLRAGVVGASSQILNRVARQAPPHIRSRASALAGKLLQPRAGAPGYFDVLVNALGIMEAQITRARLASDPPDILIEPDVRSIKPFEFHRAAAAIAAGRTAAMDALPLLTRLAR